MSDHQAPSADQAIQRQMEQFRAAVGPHVERGQPYALLDFPDYSNIGDSAIYAGELAFLDRQTGRRADCVCTWNAQMDWLRHHLPPDGPVFLQGGGNFGDIWARHQTFRHNILEHFPDRKVIQLPQSIHYRDPGGIEETARYIAAHKNFTLLVRDQPSHDLARRHFDCEVALCPDAAMMLWKLDPGISSQTDLLVVLRDDPEAVHDDIHEWLKASWPVEDWQNVDVWTMPIRTIWKIVRSLPDNRMGMIWREMMYRRQAHMRVTAGARQLARGGRIVSDRLHVHLISLLIRRPHIVLDNSYGKISRYIETWGQDPLTTRVSSLEELQKMLAH